MTWTLRANLVALLIGKLNLVQIAPKVDAHLLLVLRAHLRSGQVYRNDECQTTIRNWKGMGKVPSFYAERGLAMQMMLTYAISSAIRADSCLLIWLPLFASYCR